VCAEAQCNRRTVLHLSRARGEDLSSADLFLRAEPSQDAKAEALRNRDMSGPTSIRMVCAVIVLIRNIRQVYACDSKQLSL